MLGVVGAWARQLVHNGWGIANVLDIIHVRPLPPGLLSADHPLVTGIDPDSGTPIWPQNIVFATPRAPHDPPDAQLVTRVGQHLAHMVGLSVPRPDPTGRAAPPPSRMPPGIHYLHAGVHYNAAWLVFTSFAEAISHFSDPQFIREFRRLVAVERREPVTVFRARTYDRREFAEYVCFLRSVLPWFSNSNGPARRVLWGNPSPHAAVNTITGHWIRTVRLIAAGRPDEALRPPITRPFFKKITNNNKTPYCGPRTRALWHERLLARLTEWRIDRRGGREGLFFVDKRRLDAGWRFRGNRMIPPERRRDP